MLVFSYQKSVMCISWLSAFVRPAPSPKRLSYIAEKSSLAPFQERFVSLADALGFTASRE
jgi:hypothetical protein